MAFPPIQPLGTMLAAVFALSMGGLLWWMLHPPAQVSAAAAKAHRSLFAIKRVLVPTSGTAYSERGVELACRLGQEQRARIILAAIMEIPRTMPLDVPQPEAERQAEVSLARARSIISLHGMEAEPVVLRARAAGEEIVRLAREMDVDMIVMGIRAQVGMREAILGRTSDVVLRHAACEVIIEKLPPDSSKEA